MESYTYEATTKEGNVMKGTIQAVSERFAIDQIQDMGYFPLNVNRAEKEKAFDMDILPFLRSRVTEKDIMTFTYQLGVLLDAGFTLDKALSVLLDLSEKEDIRSALIYPLVLSIVGGAAVVVLLTFVVPKFTMIFYDMGGALPLPTIILLAVSNGLRHYWGVILLFVPGVFFYLRYYLKNESGRRWGDGLKFKLPLFGKLYKEAAVANFARTFGTLLKSGVPILNALQIVKGTLRSERLAEIISSVRDGVKKGRGISEPLKNSDFFPPLAIHMVIVGEETGRLDEMLFKIAERFDLEVRTTVKKLLSLLEPVLILSMGIVVGFIVIAMLMAIFSINELPF